MTTATTNYRKEALSDARDTVQNFIDEILEMLNDDGKASDDLLNDYPNGDSYHHKSHTDHYYDLQESAAILDQLSEYEETDSGLWEGLGMKEALASCAAFTYARAVYCQWQSLIEKIKDEADTIIDEFTTEENDLESDIDDLKSEAQDQDEEAATARVVAQAARDCVAEKQLKLDTIGTRKTEALRTMIDGLTSES